MSVHRFPKRVRLLRASEFDRVFAQRNTASDAWIVLHGATNEGEHPRLGLAVSRRLGGAVERNRWKRLAREAFRSVQHELPSLDLVCVARGQSQPTWEQLRNSLSVLSRRIMDKIEQRTRPGESGSQ
jgi:ribonuclease P protein component